MSYVTPWPQVAGVECAFHPLLPIDLGAQPDVECDKQKR